MKRFFILAACFAFSPVFGLSLNEQSKQEARLLNQFLKAVYAQRAQDPKAFQYLQETLQLDPSSKYLKRLLVAQALADEKVELAEPYANFIDEGENSAEDWLVYGAYQWKKGDLSAAQKAYEDALKLEPDNANALYQYVLLLSATDLDKAVEKLLSLAEEYPSLASDIYTELGVLAALRHNYPQALEYYNKAVEKDSSNTDARLGRGEVYEKTSQYFLMLHEFEELEKMGYANAATLSRMGSVFLMVKDFPKAEEYFLKAKAKDNGDVPSAYFLALLAEQRGDFSRAIGYLKDSSDYERSASKQLQVSFYLQRLNQPEESVKILAQAYRQFKGNVEIAYFYALALNEQKEYKKAAKVFKQLVEQNPSYEDARLQYAYVLESLKKYKEMEAQLEVLLTNNPDNAAALNLYAYSLAQRAERLDEAQEYATRALAVMPDDYSFIDTLAWIYFKQGKVDEAADLLFSISLPEILKNAEIAYHMGAVFYEQKNWEFAHFYLNAARKEIKEAEKLYKKIPAEYKQQH